MTKYPIFKQNPFTQEMKIKKRNKQIKLRTSENKAQENLLVNRITGEAEYTQLVTYRQVDESEFIKLFTQNIALTFNLSSSGLKVLNIAAYAVQKHAIGKDVIQLGREMMREFIDEFAVKMSEATLQRGIRELIENQIIAKTDRRAKFFINPNLIFNGNRLTLIDIIEKKENKDAVQKEIANQNLEIQQDQ